MRCYAHHRNSLVSTAAVAVAVSFAGCGEGVQAPQEPVFRPPVFGFGNGAPSGAHYNLNIIGTGTKNADMTDNSGHRIFVLLQGKTKILLCESGVGSDCADLDPSTFQVLDANGTDGQAKFALPDPDPENDGTTVYSVYARALGQPGGSSTNTTCGMGAGEDGILGTGDDEPVCSVIQLRLTRTRGKSTFQDVSRCLLYVYQDLNDDGRLDRAPLFDDRLYDYYWEYENQGLRLAQFRFYPVPTNVPAPDSQDVVDC